ncbi:PhzF family phenazine biosynthesis protein [Lutimaribacter sp. EGI FJ00014]|uniref:PhzF family phenazine biosynthesis protein n=1 Tax=Lutimaribacter degradans TaxID=2945989 RepID=A0ACC5ZV24_9RHOB|nr:PhzF family phenazine biosynthesis protein [Lutimaribacter sp. EGI FJ00013]MCM2562127.1 PhzF family phenazine biosynthesis protein [Lutimaribacter sp. EGI FJ00013]MCO0636257.1 PhzF family phenazine biosynthesis protein [Lutimaribacter sp. EGI FJ00014]
MTRYLVYDVFTDAPFGGNQLAVIPDATALPEADLQRLAAEFNFSEVTFVYPPANPAHTARVRIFTPTTEIPFAGHPTIGTAVALAEMGHGPDMVLELGVGPIRARAEKGAAQFTTDAALERLVHPDPALVARALGLDAGQIRTDTHPPIMASLGLPFTLTEVTDRTALAAIQTDIAAFRDGTARYPGALDFAQLAYVRADDRVAARMFAPLDNIPEDPATGSAAATLAALLAQTLGRDLVLEYAQGCEMGRPSRITLHTDGPRVTVSGRAVPVMEGRLIYRG